MREFLKILYTKAFERQNIFLKDNKMFDNSLWVYKNIHFYRLYTGFISDKEDILKVVGKGNLN